MGIIIFNVLTLGGILLDVCRNANRMLIYKPRLDKPKDLILHSSKTPISLGIFHAGLPKGR